MLHSFRDPSICPKSLYSATTLAFNLFVGGVPLGLSP